MGRGKERDFIRKPWNTAGPIAREYDKGLGFPSNLLTCIPLWNMEGPITREYGSCEEPSIASFIISMKKQSCHETMLSRPPSQPSSPALFCFLPRSLDQHTPHKVSRCLPLSLSHSFHTPRITCKLTPFPPFFSFFFFFFPPCFFQHPSFKFPLLSHRPLLPDSRSLFA